MDTDEKQGVEEETCLQFSAMGLDDRILAAISGLKWLEPTLIQEKAIPYMLEGKDILARARTGSGKTGAFVIPTIQRILDMKSSATEQTVLALFMAPSRELCRQLSTSIKQLTCKCSREVRCVDVAPTVALEAQRPLLVGKPDIVVGTPSRILAHMTAGNLDLKDSLRILVIDEADLMFAFEHDQDLQAVLKRLPSIYQSFLTSATMTTDVKALKRLVLNSPVILKLEEPPLPSSTQLSQYLMKLDEFDKAVLLYSLFKLNMISGKTIIFVNNVDRCYKLKMFFGQFDVASCALNSELPVASRCHIVEQFNSGQYDVIIASDERNLEPEAVSQDKQQKKSKRKKDKESGVSRGIDFQFVSNVINFDVPKTAESYVHRVGRTARGNNEGQALTLVSSKEMETFEELDENLKGLMGKSEGVFMDFKFDLTQLDGFKYRASDAWQRCTRIAINEMRRREVKAEILNSSKLKAFFQDNPRDLQLLRHDKSMHSLASMPQLKHVPEYIVPESLRGVSRIVKKKRKFNKRLQKDSSLKAPVGKARAKYLKRQADPLQSFKFDGFEKT